MAGTGRRSDIHSGETLLADSAAAAYGGQVASDPQIELRVARLENDSSAIYELLGEIRSNQQEHSRRFDSMDARLDSMDGRFDSVDARLDSMDGRFDSMDARLDTMDGRLDSMDGRFDSMDARLDSMDGRFDSMDARFDSVETTLAEVVRRLPEPS